MVAKLNALMPWQCRIELHTTGSTVPLWKYARLLCEVGVDNGLGVQQLGVERLGAGQLGVGQRQWRARPGEDAARAPSAAW